VTVCHITTVVYDTYIQTHGCSIVTSDNKGWN